MNRRGFLASAAAVVAGVPASTSRVRAKGKRLLVDAQTHIWLADTPDRPWFSKGAQLPEPFTIERLIPIIDSARVDRVAVIPPTLEGERIDYVQRAVSKGGETAELYAIDYRARIAPGCSVSASTDMHR